MRPDHLLLVEDDETLGEALKDNLEAEGYRVSWMTRAMPARALLLEKGGVDLVILDIMLPDLDGYAFCEHVRSANCRIPILMLTARTLEDDLLRGFETGADDFLTKPFRLRELLVRLRALLRRGQAEPPRTFCFSGFVLDAEARTLTDSCDRTIDLTRTEFDLLHLFLEHRGRALSRDQILDEVWGRDLIVASRTVDNFVSNLKRKLAWSATSSFRIRTVRGVGYRMEIDDP